MPSNLLCQPRPRPSERARTLPGSRLQTANAEVIFWLPRKPDKKETPDGVVPGLAWPGLAWPVSAATGNRTIKLPKGWRLPMLG
jgi:hypothetical protein